MNVPRRHHFVPEFYLNRWAIDGRIAVRRRDGKSFVAGTHNVAVETGFYDTHDDDGNLSTEVEDYLSDVEGAAADAMRAIDKSGRPPSLDDTNRLALARFLAFQYTRTPEHRERAMFSETVVKFLDGRPFSRDLVAEYLEEHHLGFTPSANEIDGVTAFVSAAMHMVGEVTPEMTLQIMFKSVEQCEPLLLTMHWTVEHDRKASLITSDSPFVRWRKPTVRDTFEGIGLTNAEELRFPLDPTKQLVLSHRARPDFVRLSRTQAAQRNLDLALGCQHLILGTPAQSMTMSALDLPARRPVSRFATGPAFERGPDGKLVPTGTDILQVWTPRR